MKRIIAALTIALVTSSCHQLYSNNIRQDQQDQDKNISLSIHYENTDEYGATDEYSSTISFDETITVDVSGSVFIQLLVAIERARMSKREFHDGNVINGVKIEKKAKV